MRENVFVYMDVHVCPCLICQLDIFKIFDFKTIAVRLRSCVPNYNVLLHFKTESVKILRGFHIGYMYTVLTTVVENILL